MSNWLQEIFNDNNSFLESFALMNFFDCFLLTHHFIPCFDQWIMVEMIKLFLVNKIRGLAVELEICDGNVVSTNVQTASGFHEIFPESVKFWKSVLALFAWGESFFIWVFTRFSEYDDLSERKYLIISISDGVSVQIPSTTHLYSRVKPA